MVGFIKVEHLRAVTLYAEVKGCWKELLQRCEVALEVFETVLPYLHDVNFNNIL